eukprot:TRINITY_DN2948_c0_g1_i3.p1 TRINITY_DN2948_c0_g1~~TRINITY_DN2948_c0_g1_i3.p1  ORF type:complete len:458 (-),score=69.28 TRINITY_DN2948_c0_g1_i3:49-1422(-)
MSRTETLKKERRKKEHFIPGHIEDEVINNVHHDQKKYYNEIRTKLEAIVSQEYHSKAKELMASYYPYAPDAMVDVKEQKIEPEHFLNDLLDIIRESNFVVVSKEEWEWGLQDSFTFTLPFKMSWDGFDSEIFAKFVGKRKEFKNAIEFSDKIMIFRRGIVTTSMEDYFFFEKVDLLIDSFLSVFPTNKSSQEELQLEFVDTTNGQPVIRKTLKNVLPNAASVFSRFFKKIKIEEPAFREVVVVYVPKAKEESKKRTKIEMKSFLNVPVADIEMVLPHSGLSLEIRLRDKIQIWAYFTLAAFMILYGIMYPDEQGGGQTFYAIVFVLVVRLFQLIYWIMTVRQANTDELTHTLFSKSLASNNVLLSYLSLSGEHQLIKELLIGYYILRENPEGLTIDEYSNKANDFLNKKLNLFVDFDKTSMKELIKKGIVYEKNNLYFAKDFDSSVKELVSILQSRI